jgi:protein-disulfide isomerase
MMEYGGKIDRDKIMEIAGSVGLDVPQLQKAMDDPKLKQIIERNMTLASALGVRGTPAFVVGNQFVPGAVDADALKQLIADARKRS